MAVRVNGRRWTAIASAAGYVGIDREWRDGDRIEVTLPMTLRAEPLPGTTDVVAFLYGPIVLAGRLGQQGLAPRNQIIVNERESGSMLNADVEIPVLAGDGRALATRIRQDPHRAADVSNRWCRATARRGAGALLPARTRAVQPGTGRSCRAERTPAFS